MELFRKVILIFSLSLIIFAEENIKLYNTVCNFNPKWIANGSCVLKMVARNKVRFNVDYDLVQRMDNVTLHLKLMKFYNQFRPFLINEWANLCKATSNDSPYNFFVKTLIRQAAKFSNIVICHHKVILKSKTKFFYNLFISDKCSLSS